MYQYVYRGLMQYIPGERHEVNLQTILSLLDCKFILCLLLELQVLSTMCHRPYEEELWIIWHKTPF